MSRRITAVVAVVLGLGALAPSTTAQAVRPHGATRAGAVTYRPATFDRHAAKVRVRPSHYYAFTVDPAAVARSLARATALGRPTGAVTFAVPTPTGVLQRFAVQRTRVMQPRLAAAHPEIGTWAGRALDGSGQTIALDVTPMGLHASVQGAAGQGGWYVDPAYDVAGTTTDLSYYAAAVGADPARRFAEREAPDLRRAMTGPGSRTRPGALVKHRVYRLALTSDPSYAAYFGTANVLAEKVTLIHRVNQVYNRDLGITMQLVNNEDLLNLDTTAKATGANGPCGAHACFDPANGGTPGQLDFCDVPTLGRNRTVLGQLIGASNYDIGHIALGVNGGGIAYLGVVGADYKGGGCTGLPQPTGDFYAIDYVAHEMGHEFGADHTFNGVDGACADGNRYGPTSVEPGSGSSVMAYAGICGLDDLQPHTDPYFSERSHTEMSAYTSSVAPLVTEVQTVSLRGFTANGDQITLDFPGATAPVTLTRGSTYNAAGIKAAVQQLTGLSGITVAGWGYDPFNSFSNLPAPLTAPDDTGFQVIFASSPDPTVYGGAGDVASLTVSSPTSGVSGFVGETAQGGPAGNRGHTITVSANHAPVAHAGPDHTVPVQTPFRLAGAGKDKDGDRLTYLWEQNDVGANKGTPLTSNHKVYGPLFRVFGTVAHVTNQGTLQSPSPGENLAGHRPVRWFPDLRQVLSGNTDARTGQCPPLPANATQVRGRLRDCYSEFLPTASYVGRPGSSRPAMHFRLTVRDNDPTVGGRAFDDVTVVVDRHAGPFLVTSQRHRGSHARAGHRMSVRWKVNGTRALAARVRIKLSLDGGHTWRRLGARTANDGRAVVVLPHVHSRHARIMVKAVGDIFYAVNRRGFAIR